MSGHVPLSIYHDNLISYIPDVITPRNRFTTILLAIATGFGSSTDQQDFGRVGKFNYWFLGRSIQHPLGFTPQKRLRITLLISALWTDCYARRHSRDSGLLVRKLKSVIYNLTGTRGTCETDTGLEAIYRTFRSLFNIRATSLISSHFNYYQCEFM